MSFRSALTALFVSLALSASSIALADAFKATIAEPAAGSQVISPIRLKGKVTGELPQGHELWFVVRKGSLMWPKDPAVFVVGEDWSATVNEGTRGEFSLVLFLVGKDGQEQIKRWIEAGRATGHFPGLEKIEGKPVAQVTVQQP
jgi:hypothetical protein